MSGEESTVHRSGVVTSLYHRYWWISIIDEKTMKDSHRFSIVPDFSTVFRSWKRDSAIDEKTMKDFHRLSIVSYFSTVFRFWRLERCTNDETYGNKYSIK